MHLRGPSIPLSASGHAALSRVEGNRRTRRTVDLFANSSRAKIYISQLLVWRLWTHNDRNCTHGDITSCTLTSTRVLRGVTETRVTSVAHAPTQWGREVMVVVCGVTSARTGRF
jgi:hypothetical protein